LNLSDISGDRAQPKQFYIQQPIFEGARNAVIECQVEGCDWTLTGPRNILKKAWNEHYRMYHSQEIGKVAIKGDLRDSLWLPR
jgi:hypothetical protein